MRRCFATVVTFAGLLFFCTRTGLAQQDLPLMDDDLAYAGKLVARGLEDLALDIYLRLEARPGITPKDKLTIGRRLVDAYRALASKAPDLEARNDYLARADRKMTELVKQFGSRVLTPEFRYQQALVLQTQGRSLAKAIKEETDAGRKKTLVAEAAKKLDECAQLLEEIAKETKATVEAERQKDPIGYLEKVKDVRIVLIKAELQRAWTGYYKANLYESGEDEYKTTLSEAVRLFGKFVDDYPEVLAIVNARYGRGLCYKLLERLTEARDDFAGTVKIIDEAGAIPEVQADKARCTVQWAEISARLGQHDEAIAGLDKMLAENPALAENPELAELGLLTKGKVLGSKAEKLKKDGDNDGALKLYQQAIGVLREVVRKGGRYAWEAGGLIAKYVEKGGIADVDPESRLAHAEVLLRERKYPDAIVELRNVLDKAAPGIKRESLFKARRMLAFALRATRAYDEAIKEYGTIGRLYQDQPREDLAEVHLQYSLTLGMYAKANPRKPELDQGYVESLKELADKYPDTTEGTNARYYYGEALKERADSVEKWEAAARVYAQVSEQSKYYGRARYLEGLCYYNVYRLYSSKRDAENPKAAEALQKAQQKLVEVIQNLPPPKAGESWHVEAAQALADIHLDLKHPQDALKVVDMVTKKYPALAVGDPKLLAIRLKIYIAIGKLEEAVTVVDELAQKKAESSVLLRGYMTLGDAYQKEGDRLKNAGKLEEGEKAHKTAVGLLKMAVPHVKDDPIRMLKWLATRLYLLEDYKTCIEALDAIEKGYVVSGLKADSQLWGLRILKAKCYKAMEYWPAEALRLLDQLAEQYAQVASIKMLRASVHETKKEWEKALELWYEVVNGVKPRSPDWWEAQYHRAKCYYEMGDIERGNQIIKQLKALHPKMSDAETKKKFEDLWDKYNK